MFLVLGLGAGAVYAALGLGLVLEHRVSGVVNFAHGAMAMYPTYVFVEARARGDLALPLAGLPVRVHVTDQPSLLLALAAGLLAAALLGLVVYALVFRPLRTASPLARVVASVGVMLVLQALVVLRFGAGSRPVAAVLPARPLSVWGLAVPRDRAYLALIVVLAAAALWAVYRFTRFGLASRAAAENPRVTSLLGYSVDRLAAVNWVVASVLAGLAGILAAPITSLNPATYSLLVVPALAAAMVGRLSSFGITVAAGLALGMAQSEIVKLQTTFDWVPRVGIREGLPLVVIVVVMAVAGRRLPTRAEPAVSRLPEAGRPRRPWVSAAAVVPAAAVALAVLGGEERLALITSLIGALVCLSLVLLTGYLGQISLAQMAFAGVAGFTLSKLTEGLGIPFPLAPALAALAAAAVGLVIGLPALRLRGVDLAVVTIAGAVAVEELVFRNPSLTAGFAGSQVSAPSVFGIDLGIGSRGAGDYPSVVFGLMVLAVVAAAGMAVAQIRVRPLGRRLLAIRANERAATAAGVDVGTTKVAAFVVSAFLAGAAGALLGYQQGQLSYSSFGVFVSLSFLAVASLGGIASVAGALVGGALVAGGLVFTVLDDVAGWGRYQFLASGLGLTIIAVCYPEGMAGAGHRLLARATRRSRATAR